MQLTHSFTVPVGVDEAFAVLLDIERIGPCMPGATIESVDEDEFTGRVKVRVGPMQLTYRGQASFTEVDEERYRAKIVARGKETRGTGTADATVTAELRAHGDETEVSVVTDLAVTGKPAQFGRGVMSDVGSKLLDQFATCLAEELAGPAPDETATDVLPPAPLEDHAPDETTATTVGPERAATSASKPGAAARSTTRRTDESIDLLQVAGGPLVRRVTPVLLALALGGLVGWLLGRRR